MRTLTKSFPYLLIGLILFSGCKHMSGPDREGNAAPSLEDDTSKNPSAMNELGDQLYRHGRGDPTQFEKAVAAYRIAAGAGLSNAQFYYARMHQYGHGCDQDYEIAWQYYKLAAEGGDRRAWNNLGFMMKEGQGRSADPTASLPYFKRSSEMGMPMGSYNVAIHYHIVSDPKDFAEAIRYYELAIEQYPRYAQAYNQIGRIYENGGYGIKADKQQAFDAFLLAATYGEKYGPFNVGRFYREGWVVPQDLRMAERLFNEAARRGKISAWNAAGSLYWLTKYKQQDLHKALHYYLKAAEAGDSEFLHRIGYIYKDGPEELLDASKAYGALKRSAELNQPRGIRSLGYCYAYGIGTDIDRDKAEALWLSLKGTKLMQWHQLGLLMTREDTNLPPDLEKAESYLQMGTESEQAGQAESWRYLGYLYRDAPPPMHDMKLAQTCFSKAAAMGDGPAAEALKHILKSKE